MELNNKSKNKLLKLISETLNIYKEYFDEMTYTICTSCDDQMEIEFLKDTFIKNMHLESILDFSDQSINNLDVEEKKKINNRCSKFINMGPITLQTVCCLIDYNNKTYMIVKGNLGKIIFVLQKNQNNKFIITDIKNSKYLYHLIGANNAKIYFPTKLETFKENEKIYSESLSENNKKDKLLNIKEALYLDKDGNARKDDEKISTSYFYSKIS